MTFDNGPATYVGNHYFSAWAGFFLSFAVFGSVLKEFLGAGDAPAAAAETGGEYPTCDFRILSCVLFLSSHFLTCDYFLSPQ
jgi:hypothetical protein